MNLSPRPDSSDGDWLRCGDPAGALSPQEETALRTATLRAASTAESDRARDNFRPGGGWWAAGALVAACLAVVTVLHLRDGAARPLAVAPPPTESAAPLHTRQVQFVTPGGTRIIWTFGPSTERPSNGEQLDDQTQR
jgi:hypothetical protein